MLLVLLFEPIMYSIITSILVVILLWRLHVAAFMTRIFDTSGTRESGVRAE